MQNSEALLFCLLKHVFNEQNWCFPFIELCLALAYTAYLSLHVNCCGWLQWLQPASPSQSRQQGQGGTRKQPQECADRASSTDALTEKAPTKLIPQRPNLRSKSSSHGMTSGRVWGTTTLDGSHWCTRLTHTFLKDQSTKTIQTEHRESVSIWLVKSLKQQLPIFNKPYYTCAHYSSSIQDLSTKHLINTFI